MTLWRVRHALTSLQHQERGFADPDGMQSVLLVTLQPFYLGETSPHHSRCPPVEAFQLIGVQSPAVQKVGRLLELTSALLWRQRPLLVSCRWLAASPLALVRLSSRLARVQGPQTSCKSRGTHLLTPPLEYKRVVWFHCHDRPRHILLEKSSTFWTCSASSAMGCSAWNRSSSASAPSTLLRSGSVSQVARS